MNTDITNCLYVKVGNLERATTFFRDFLGMEVEQSSFDTNPCVIVKQDKETNILLSEKSYSNQISEIIINTSDCIEQYCLLKSKGVSFKHSPTYFPEGLKAEFTDDDGNRYILLELRKYEN